MNKFFIGCLLALLDYKINIFHGRFDILPDFIGYYFIYASLKEKGSQSDNFIKSSNLAGVLVGVSVFYAIYELLFSGSILLGLVNMILGIIVLVVEYKHTMSFIDGLADVEASSGIELYSADLRKKYKTAFVCAIAAVLTIILVPIALILMIVCLVFYVLYLITLNKMRNSYNAEFGA